jgi:hypothetical protein
MSWNKKAFKEAYSRAQSKVDIRRQHHEESYENYWDIWCMMQDEYSDEMAPTVKEIATGRLLTMLVKLNVRFAQKELDKLYW